MSDALIANASEWLVAVAALLAAALTLRNVLSRRGDNRRVVRLIKSGVCVYLAIVYVVAAADLIDDAALPALVRPALFALLMSLAAYNLLDTR